MHSFKNISALIIVLIVVSGCSSFGADEPRQPQEAVAGGHQEIANPSEVQRNVRPATSAELELKIAKLWSRLDELESLTLRQKERLKIVERGLLLGIIPDELKNEADKAFELKAKEPIAEEKVKAEEAKVAAEPQTVPSPPVETELSADADITYHKLLTQAQDDFHQGRYGKAIADYSLLAEKFPEQTKNGNHDYWIALSWAGLREYETAIHKFNDFIKTFPENTWVPRAKYHLAKVEYQMGYRERALQRMRQLIKDHPGEDATEMAKSEISNMEKSL